MSTKPEVALIDQLNQARQALQEERESLVARIATIDEALGVQPQKAAKKEPKGSKKPKAGIKEAVLTILGAGGPLTIKQVQDTIGPDASPKSVEAVMHGLVTSGHLIKDASMPRKFSLISKKTNGAKTNGASASGS